MNPREFFDAVSKMRRAQREYFRTKNQDILPEKVRLERMVDNEIYRAEAFLKAQESFPMFDLKVVE